MRKLLIIKTGTTFASIRQQFGDFDDYIINQMGIPASDVLTVPVYISRDLPALADVSAIVITGSHAMVTERKEWSLFLADWLRHIRPACIPVLGICYGHQLIADAWGGNVDYHPDGEEMGTVEVELTEAGKQDILLGCLPERFLGHVAHAQTVKVLPPAARLLARNAFEQHHAFVIEENVWGVQFHPEFSAAVTQAYIEKQSDEPQEHGRNPAALIRSVSDHFYGQQLLRRFLSLIP